MDAARTEDSWAAMFHLKGIEMFLGLGVVLLILWLLGFVVFHVSAFAIHILIILAIISVIFHFLRGR